jgi:hypothetical protein
MLRHMARPPLDEIDHELLALLQKDASRTLLDLGRAVQLSPTSRQPTGKSRPRSPSSWAAGNVFGPFA